jgi:hypothetical protein
LSENISGWNKICGKSKTQSVYSYDKTLELKQNKYKSMNYAYGICNGNLYALNGISNVVSNGS